MNTSQEKVVRISLKDNHSLSRLGYHMRNSNRSRHIALNKAIKAYGSSYVIKKLNVLRIYNGKRHPDLATIAHEDVMYVQNKRNSMSPVKRAENIQRTRLFHAI